MSLIYKRPGSPFWYVHGTRKSTKTTVKTHAEEYAKKYLEREWRAKELGQIKRTWSELWDEWQRAKASKRTLDKDELIFRNFQAILKRRKIEFIDEINSGVISQYVAERQKTCEPSTINRHTNTIRAMLRMAADFDPPWIPKAPKISRLEVIPGEPRALKGDEFGKIVQYLKPMDMHIAQLALMTGMRQDNTCSLEWSWFNEDRTVITVPMIQTKTKRTYVCVVPEAARKLLETLSNDTLWVFPHKGRPRAAESVSHAWRKAAWQAGLDGIKFHDLRHTWATTHTRNGTPDRILQSLGGWSSMAMVNRYSHHDTEHLKEFAQNAVARSSENSEKKT